MTQLVVVRLAPDVARHIQQGLADLACWARGFSTAMRLSDKFDLEPIGISELRDMHIALKGGLDDFEKQGEQPDPIRDALVQSWLVAFDVYDAAEPGSEAQLVASYIHNSIVNFERTRQGTPLLEAVWPLPTKPKRRQREPLL